MSKKFLIIVLTCSLLSFVSYAEDRVLAEYDGKTINKSEITERLKFLLGGQLPEGKKDFDDIDSNTKQAIIQEIVQQKIIEDNMASSKIKDSKIFQHQVEEAKKKAAIDVYLQNYAKRHINESMIKTEYSNYVNMLKNNPEVKISHIVLATEEEAKKILIEIKSGKAFEDVAKQYSTDKSTKDRGGEIGYITKGQAFPSIEKAAYKLNVGEVSEPVQTQVGWHILKVLDIKKQEIPTFDTIRAQLEQQTAYKVISDYMKKLIQDAKVKIYPNKTEIKNSEATATRAG